jgi:hypothetical protein
MLLAVTGAALACGKGVGPGTWAVAISSDPVTSPVVDGLSEGEAEKPEREEPQPASKTTVKR